MAYRKRIGSPKFRRKHLDYPLWRYTPAGHCTLTISRLQCYWFPAVPSLDPLRQCKFRGCIAFTFVIVDSLLSSGFTRFVTSPCAEFRTGLLVRLWPGWLSSLLAPAFLAHGTCHFGTLNLVNCLFLTRLLFSQFMFFHQPYSRTCLYHPLR